MLIVSSVCSVVVCGVVWCCVVSVQCCYVVVVWWCCRGCGGMGRLSSAVAESAWVYLSRFHRPTAGKGRTKLFTRAAAAQPGEMTGQGLPAQSPPSSMCVERQVAV